MAKITDLVISGTTTPLDNEGYLNTTNFPDPTNETQTRTQLQKIPSEIRAYLNSTVKGSVNDLYDEVDDVDADLTSHKANTNNPHSVTKAQVGLGNCDNTSDLNKPISTATQAALDLKTNISDIKDNLTSTDTNKPLSAKQGKALNDNKVENATFNAHKNNTSNPHNVTKTQVGLGNVDNTSDANKPISTATQNALNAKTNLSDFNLHKNNTNNPHNVTKSQIGLGSVDNTSDLAKPISTATQAQLDIRVKYADIVDNYESTANDKALSGNKGRELKTLVDSKEPADPTILKQSNVVDNLSSDSSIYPLSAKQGKVLKTQSDRTDRSLDYLWKKSKGVIYDTEVVNGTTYDVDIPSGAMEYAEAQMIGGKSIKFNQQVQNGNFESTSGWTMPSSAHGTVAINNNELSNTYISQYPSVRQSISIPANHKIFVTISYKASTSKVFSFSFFFTDFDNTSVLSQPFSYTTSYQKYEGILTHTSGLKYLNIAYLDPHWSAGDIVYAKNVMIIDLTQMYGSGNEPTTVAQFKSQFPLDYYAYDTGSIKDAKVDKQISNGKNLFLLANSGVINADGTISQNNDYGYTDYIKIDNTICLSCTNVGDVWRIAYYDINKNFIERQLNSSLSFVINTDSTKKYIRVSTKKDITNAMIEYSSSATSYKPYFNHEYPINSNIQAIEGYGIGIDSNHFNKVLFDRKVFRQEVGSRAYQSGDENNASYLTDMTTTYYPLESPIETDISQYIGQDDTIREVEANGTLQNHYPLLDNGYGINMNSTLECMVEVSEVQ